MGGVTDSFTLEKTSITKTEDFVLFRVIPTLSVTLGVFREVRDRKALDVWEDSVIASANRANFSTNPYRNAREKKESIWVSRTQVFRVFHPPDSAWYTSRLGVVIAMTVRKTEIGIA